MKSPAAVQGPKSSARAAASGLIQRTCACGNHTSGGPCVECEKKRVQPRLAINTPGDEFELEADRVADEITSGEGRDFSRVPTHTDPPASQPVTGVSAIPIYPKIEVGPTDDPLERDADRIAEQALGESRPYTMALGDDGPPDASRPKLQRRGAAWDEDDRKDCVRCKPGVATVPASPKEAPPSVHEVLQSHGSPLDASARAFMEARFGRELGSVRIHTDEAAARSAAAVGAAAYTFGSHIAFATGRYAPNTSGGRKLLAHELAHVVQQRRGDRSLRRGPDLEALKAALTPPYDFPKAAEILNGFSPDDMKKALSGLSRGLVASIYVGATNNKNVGADSAVGQATRPAFLDLNFENELKKLDWMAAAKFLNGFNADDIKSRLAKRTDEEVQNLHDGAVANPDVGDKSGAALVTAEVLAARRNAPQPKAPAPPPPPTTAACPTTYTKATSFKDMIALVRAAEAKLTAAGITGQKDQIHALRGIYYGTLSSLDYSVEKSTTRNEGFQRFTRPSQDPSKTVPPDLTKPLDCGLFKALQDSQDLIDPSGRQVDFGHLIIGMDARNDPALASNVKYPVATPLGGTIDIDLGGTGTELVTWLGDLGGGAASLAMKRVTAPTTSVSSVFVGSDYGGSINLEGDIAASVVATSSPSAVTAPVFASGKGLADAIEEYLSPAAPSASWKTRATTFLTMNGGKVDAAGALTNRDALIKAFAAKIQSFGCNYIVSRAKDKHVAIADAKTAASTYLVSASVEVATAFVDALEDSRKSGGRIVATRFPSPTSGGGSACGAQLLAVQFVGP